MRLVSKFAGDLLWLMSTDSGSEFGKININIEKYIYENIIIIKIKMSTELNLIKLYQSINYLFV